MTTFHVTLDVQPGGNKGKDNMWREEGVENFGILNAKRLKAMSTHTGEK